jgi:hypothetical protein
MPSRADVILAVVVASLGEVVTMSVLHHAETWPLGMVPFAAGFVGAGLGRAALVLLSEGRKAKAGA